MIHLALVSIASVWLLWGCYVVVMGLKRTRDAKTLTKAQKVFGYPWLFLGLALDLIVNTFIASALFLELPREFTLSSRLWRLSNGAAGWRRRVALAIRVGLLDSIDPSGTHEG